MALRRFAARVVAAGSIASVLSIMVASAFARRRTGSVTSASNATSHWVWGEPARRRHDVSLRHTLLGYAIHHASSIWWAGFHEAGLDRTRAPAWLVAPVVGTAAMVVDYGVVPKRLTPGFERHLSRSELVAVYVAFSAGLWLGSRLTRGLRQGRLPPAWQRRR